MFFRKFAVISRSENYYFSYVSTDWCIIYIFNDLIFLNSNLPQSGDYCMVCRYPVLRQVFALPLGLEEGSPLKKTLRFHPRPFTLCLLSHSPEYGILILHRKEEKLCTVKRSSLWLWPFAWCCPWAYRRRKREILRKKYPSCRSCPRPRSWKAESGTR